MDFLLSLKRPFIWLSRFRYRCGYGVHSPFAFNLITDVIYEKAPYYAYEALATEQSKVAREKGWRKECAKVSHLLFRLVNRVQPRTLVEVGRLSTAALYLQAGGTAAEYLFAADLTELFLDAGQTVDFLYLNDATNPALMGEVFNLCADRTTKYSLFVVKGVGYSAAMRSLWKRMVQDERVGITFDLYDVGLLFFDTTKIKQTYIVNF